MAKVFEEQQCKSRHRVGVRFHRDSPRRPSVRCWTYLHRRIRQPAGSIGAIIAHMFDTWQDIDGYTTLFPCDRPVTVDTSWLPPSGTRRDNLALWIKAGGL